MINGKVLKILGLTATVFGFGVDCLSEWVNEKKMNAKIAEIVAEELAKRSK